MMKSWKSFLLKPVHDKPEQNGWYETSTDGFATSVVLYWRNFEWVIAPDSPSDKGHVRQDRAWRAIP